MGSRRIHISEELKLKHTRKALEVASKYGFGITLITKSNRVLRFWIY